MKYAVMTLWIISILVLLFQAFTALDELPDFIKHKSEMMPRGKFLGIIYGTAVIFNLFFGAFPFLAAFMPEKTINMFIKKNQEHWLKTPERMKYALSQMAAMSLWFGLVINSIFWYIMYLTISSARAGVQQKVSPLMIIMILAGVAVGGVYGYFAFKVPKQ